MVILLVYKEQIFLRLLSYGHISLSNENKKTSKHFCFEVNVREKIRTPDTLVRSQVLYPAELHVHKRTLFRIRF